MTDDDGGDAGHRRIQAPCTTNWGVLLTYVFYLFTILCTRYGGMGINGAVINNNICTRTCCHHYIVVVVVVVVLTLTL